MNATKSDSLNLKPFPKHITGGMWPLHAVSCLCHIKLYILMAAFVSSPNYNDSFFFFLNTEKNEVFN